MGSSPFFRLHVIRDTSKGDVVSTTVRYRDIPGYVGYFVGDNGTVWSRWKTQGQGRGWAIDLSYSRLLTPHPSGPDDPHLKVTLRLGGRRRSEFVHRLVLLAFVGPCPPGMECRHGDGDPTNNAATNLSWGTRTQNRGDRKGHGTETRGERNGKTKLTKRDVLRIVRLRGEGLTHAAIGRKTGCPKPTVGGILSGRTWSHVTGITRYDTDQG